MCDNRDPDFDDIARRNLDHAKDEWALIQGKIDSIGDFKHKIRGWCVTLVTTVTGIILWKNPHFIMLCAPPLFIGLFYVEELVRTKEMPIYFKRIGILETAIKSIHSFLNNPQAFGNMALITSINNLMRKRCTKHQCVDP